MENIWWQKEVVYQIYPKSFNDSNGDGIGDIKGITEKLDYLAELGVTMLWICPLYKSPMDDNGYDVADYMSIAEEFGSMEDLDELIQKAKEKGMKIIMDLVINHTSDEHEWFQKALADETSEYHEYYIFKKGEKEPNNWRSVFGGSVWEKVAGRDEYYFHAFGKKQPDLNWENPKLREKIYKMINWWLERGIAGFRVDAINFIKKDLSFKDREADGADGLAKCTKATRNQPGLGKFLKELQKKAFRPHQCVTVAETAGLAYEDLEEYIGKDGYFSMIFDFKYADLDIASGSEWYKRLPWTIRDLNEKIMRSQTSVQRYGWAANFIENHDQPRATTKYLGDAQNDPKAVKALGAMYFFLRGTPFIYQGQELGMVNFERTSKDQFNDLSSIDQYERSIAEGMTPAEALHIVNLRSRDNVRTPFPWERKRYGGFSEVRPWLAMTEEYPSINAAAQVGQKESVFTFYKEMIAFRQKGRYSDVLIYGDIVPVKSTENVIAYKRVLGDKSVWCWFNLGQRTAEERLPKEITPKNRRKFVWGDKKSVTIKENILEIPPYHFILMSACEIESKEE